MTLFSKHRRSAKLNNAALLHHNAYQLTLRWHSRLPFVSLQVRVSSVDQQQGLCNMKLTHDLAHCIAGSMSV